MAVQPNLGSDAPARPDDRPSSTTQPTGTAAARTALVRLTAAAVAGVAMGLAFPPLGWWWLAFLAPAALTLLCRGVRARLGFGLGFVFGLAYFLVLIEWLTVIGWDAWIVLSAVQALFLGVLGWALAKVWSLPGWPLWASLLWIAVEYARSHVPLGGFAWGRVAFALDESPLASYASLGGAPLVGFAAVLGGHLLAWAVLAGSLTPARRGLGRSLRSGGRSLAGVARGIARTSVLPRLAAAGGAAAVVGGGLLVPLPDGASDEHATAAVVQGNIPGSGMDFLGRARTVTRNHLAATEELMADVEAGVVDRPDFVLWPENSTDLSPFSDEPTAAMVDEAASLVGVPLLIGSTRDGPDPATQRRNLALLYEGAGEPRQVYEKRHPVPFGEYIPFRDFFTSFIGRLDVIQRDMVAGSEPGVFDLGPARVGVAICFEVAWDELIRDAALDGSEAIVVQTNNATYLGTGQLEQQFATTRLRAIEHGKTVLVASTSGISAIVAPDGTVVEKSGERTREVFVERVPLRSTNTLATTVGSWPERVMVGVGVVALVAGVWYGRRNRQPANEREGSAEG